MLSNNLILCFPLLMCVCVWVFLLIFTSYFLCLFPHQIFQPLSQIPYNYTVEVRNRFKGLDLIDRVPGELWMEVPDIVQETGIKTISKKKKCKKTKWLSEEALQTAVKKEKLQTKEKRKDIPI